MKTRFDPSREFAGSYHPADGTVAFFQRIRSILPDAATVIDLGAGRGAWHHEDRCSTRRILRDLKPAAKLLIGMDVDPAVSTNPTTHENRIITDGRLPCDDNFADVIFADYVLEHVTDPLHFTSEIRRALKPGGYFCARTPHSLHYVSLFARIVANAKHSRVLRHAQPNRKAEDVFPTCYRLNTLRAIRRSFPGFTCMNYLHTPEPSYFFGRKIAFELFNGLHHIAPRAFVSNIFCFMRKHD